MKKVLLFILSVYSSLNAQTQFNYAFHDTVETAISSGGLIELYGDFYFPTLKYNFANFGDVNFCKVSKNGGLVYKKLSPVDFIPKCSIKTLDNKLIYVGMETFCDVLQPPFRNYIVKVDTSGVTSFTNVWQENYLDEVKNVIQYTDSSYFAFTDSIMYHFDKNGQLILRKNTGLKGILSALALPVGSIVLSAKNASVNSLNTMNTNGVITASVAAQEVFRKMTVYHSNQVMCLGDDQKIYRISASLTALSNSNFGPSIFVRDFYLKSDTLYCITDGNNQVYLVADTLLNLAHTNTITSGGIFQMGIVRSQAMVGVLSIARSKPTTDGSAVHYYLAMNSFQKMSGANFSSDISIVSQVVDSSYAIATVPSNTSIPINYQLFLRAKIKVKNKGTAPLTSFKINTYLNSSISCGQEYYTKQFSVSPVNPGDTVEVITGFAQRYNYISGPLQTAVSEPFCFFATVPDKTVDKNYVDNELCNTFVFPVTVSVEQHYLETTQFFLFPNPVNSTLTIKGSYLMNTISLIDQLGRIVYTRFVQSESVDVGLQELPQGIYLLRIETEKGIVTKKVIKQ